MAFREARATNNAIEQGRVTPKSICHVLYAVAPVIVIQVTCKTINYDFKMNANLTMTIKIDIPLAHFNTFD
jgi:hypothetical protein